MVSNLLHHRPRWLSPLVVLVAVLTILPAQSARADSFMEEATSNLESVAEGHDYEYRWNGSSFVLVNRYPLGTLNTSTNAASAPNRSGLTLVATVCLQLDKPKSYGRHCWHKYKPAAGDSDPDNKYRLYYVTGSSKSKTGYKLTRVVDRIDSGNDNHVTVEWAPTGTTSAGSCSDKTVTLGVDGRGFSGSVSSTFTTCPETFGLDFIGPRQFRFDWEGKRSAGSWVGMGGGVMYRIPENGNPNMNALLGHGVCSNC